MAGNGRVSLASRIEGGPVQKLRRAQFVFGSGRLEQAGELLDHRAAKLLRIHDIV
jgi:hypothetical protein